MANMTKKPNRSNSDAVSDSLVAGLQSHYDRCQLLSVDVPEAAREEIVGLTIDMLVKWAELRHLPRHQG